MIWSNPHSGALRHALGLVLIVSGLGCAQSPHVKGHWIGTVVNVDVHDRDGKTFHAAALRIESGPPWPDKLGNGYWDAARGGGTLPLLVRQHSAEFFIQSPQALHEGHRVRISGTMYGLQIRAVGEGRFPSNERDVSRELYHLPNSRTGALMPMSEHVIVIRGKAKVLKE